MYARRHGGRDLTFDFAEGLVDDNLLVVDRETGSVWSQLGGKAIAGEMKDTPLQATPAIQATWGFWRRRHPETRVMLLPGISGRAYRYSDFVPGDPQTRAVAHNTATLGLGLAIRNAAWFFPFPELAEAATPLQVSVAGTTVVLHFDADGSTAWAENEAGELLMSVLAYEQGWRNFYPHTHVWK